MELCIDERAIDAAESRSSLCEPPINYESHADESDTLSDISKEMSSVNNEVISHLPDFSDIFEALADEDFANEDNRKRFIAAQLQMLEQFGLGSSDISSSSRSVDADLDLEGIASGGNPSRSTQTNVLNYMLMGSRPEHALQTLSDMRAQRVRFRDGSSDFGEDEEEDDEDMFFRVQMELMRRLGLFDEDGILPYADMRLEQECQVCFDMVRLSVRQCCQQAVCDACLQQYVETQLVDYGNLLIGCPNPDCDNRVYTDEVRNLLRGKPELRERYDRWIVDLNGDPNRKTCPRCCHITEIESSVLTCRKVAKKGLKVECVECQLEWCFPCQSPWHERITCKKFRTGDVLLKNWAREHIRRGECNAQRCPKCKVYIQRSDGCDHMTCSRCNTNFCYRCGCRRLPSLKLFGYPLEDHDLKRSIIGCNSEYKQGKPMRRAISRGALFGAKVVGGAVAMPVVVGLAAGAVGLAAGVAAVALPAYGTYRLARKIRERVRERKL